LGVSSTLSEISERIEAVRYSPDRPILWVGWDMGYSVISLINSCTCFCFISGYCAVNKVLPIS